MTAPKPSAAVIGAGPAGLTAAETLAAGGAAVTIFDRMPTFGRKFLLAGRGGLNLTHSEPLARFLDRYRPGNPTLCGAVERFAPADLRAWSSALGQDTFVGSSGRVFPVAMKASPLLRAWLRKLAGMGVAFAPRHRWIGWHPDGALQFTTPDGDELARPDVVVLALGGASWPQLGADGSWVPLLDPDGSAVAPLRAANCGFAVSWSAPFRDRFEGTPLKNVALRWGDQTTRGDAIVTREGLEGGAVYALSAPLRDALVAAGPITVELDLRPDMAVSALGAKLEGRAVQQSLSTTLRKRLHLAPVAIGLLHEAALGTGQSLGQLTPRQLAAAIKAVPVRLEAAAPLARAISTAGGLRFSALDEQFMLRDRPGVFAAGEMLDWEAPTGGYLLQASFATGMAAGAGALAWLSSAGQRQTEPHA